jgi:hypothetical protein
MKTITIVNCSVDWISRELENIQVVCLSRPEAPPSLYIESQVSRTWPAESVTR